MPRPTISVPAGQRLTYWPLVTSAGSTRKGWNLPGSDCHPGRVAACSRIGPGSLVSFLECGAVQACTGRLAVVAGDDAVCQMLGFRPQIGGLV